MAPNRTESGGFSAPAPACAAVGGRAAAEAALAAVGDLMQVQTLPVEAPMLTVVLASPFHLLAWILASVHAPSQARASAAAQSHCLDATT